MISVLQRCSFSSFQSSLFCRRECVGIPWYRRNERTICRFVSHPSQFMRSPWWINFHKSRTRARDRQVPTGRKTTGQKIKPDGLASWLGEVDTRRLEQQLLERPAQKKTVEKLIKKYSLQNGAPDRCAMRDAKLPKVGFPALQMRRLWQELLSHTSCVRHAWMSESSRRRL